jgi:hypothetical protein
LSYIKEKLALGKKLSESLLQRNLNAGKIVTKLPFNVQENEAKDFESGAKLPSSILQTDRLTLEPVPDTDPLLATEISTFLEGGRDRICIFEDASVEPSDPFLKSIDTRFSTLGNEVYHLICQADTNDDQLLKTIRRAHSWLFIGIMTFAPNKLEICSRTTLTLDEIRILAGNAERIIVAAYDGEGYLTWTKR